MARFRCPGQNSQQWRFTDIFEVSCPHCGAALEFWKDEPVLVCRHCHQEVRNPRIDRGCAAWCKHADKCLGIDLKKGTDA